MEKENKTGIQELKNEAVEEAMKAFLADKTNQTMANLMAVMRDARFESRSGSAGSEFLRRPRLRKHRQTHHGPKNAPDEDITEKGAPLYEYCFDGA